MPEPASPPEDSAPNPTAGHEHERNSDAIEEPETPGTVFLTLVLLMLIFGFWVMMYVVLIDP